MGISFALIYAWTFFWFYLICPVFINRYSKWNFWLTFLVLIFAHLKTLDIWTQLRTSIKPNYPSWTPVSLTRPWTSCWRWAATSKSTIFPIMQSTTWNTTQMDPAPSIPWVYSHIITFIKILTRNCCFASMENTFEFPTEILALTSHQSLKIK